MDLTPAMQRELRAIALDGSPSDPVDWHYAPEGLWFHARDRVIVALLRRGLIHEPPDMAGYSLTPLGESVLAELGKVGVRP